jgi:mono/diheme cytochrome c family protein
LCLNGALGFIKSCSGSRQPYFDAALVVTLKVDRELCRDAIAVPGVIDLLQCPGRDVCMYLQAIVEAKVCGMRLFVCAISIAASSVVAVTGVAHAQGTEIGKYEYLNSCASCHGVTGKGDGPVVKSLIKPPANLTRLSDTNGGVFPFARVYDVIDGRLEVATHGTRDMPVWGDIYKRGSAQPQSGTLPYLSSKEVVESIVRVRILALIDYIFTLQETKR